MHVGLHQIPRKKFGGKSISRLILKANTKKERNKIFACITRFCKSSTTHDSHDLTHFLAFAPLKKYHFTDISKKSVGMWDILSNENRHKECRRSQH